MGWMASEGDSEIIACFLVISEKIAQFRELQNDYIIETPKKAERFCEQPFSAEGRIHPPGQHFYEKMYPQGKLPAIWVRIW